MFLELLSVAVAIFVGWATRASDGKLFFIGVITILICAGFLFTERFSDEWLIGDVVGFYKGHKEETTLTLGASPGVGVKEEIRVLGEYEIAVRIPSEIKVEILENNNSLLWFKFDKREIQLSVKLGQRYKFRVYGLIGKRNILEIKHAKGD